MPSNQIPIIDYESHPAFAGWPSHAPDSETDGLIQDIDAAYAGIRDNTASSHALLQDFDHIVAPKFESLSARLVGNSQTSDAHRNFLHRALTIARESMRHDLEARARTVMSNSTSQKLRGRFQDALSLMRRDGFYDFQDAQLARSAWNGTILERAYLRARAKKWPTRHSVISLHPQSPGAIAIRKMVEKSGLLDFVSAYLGKPAEFYYAALDYAHPAQNWYKDCYADAGLTTSKTVYMHFDADCDIIKALFYLNDVGPKDGAFRFVRGSHLWNRSPLSCAVQKGFDEASNALYQRSRDGIDYLSGYYRPRFKDHDHRIGQLSLPAALRGSTHFGDDILDGSDLSESLLAEERSFIAPAGTMVVFDGSRGIHRGSQTEAGGERWAIQIAFRVYQNGAAQNPSKRQSLRSLLRGKASWLKHLVRDFASLRVSD